MCMPTRQGKEHDLQSKESWVLWSNSPWGTECCQQWARRLLWMRSFPSQAFRWDYRLSTDTLIMAMWDNRKQRMPLSHTQIPITKKLSENMCYFKMRSFGAISWAATIINTMLREALLKKLWATCDMMKVVCMWECMCPYLNMEVGRNFRSWSHCSCWGPRAEEKNALLPI